MSGNEALLAQLNPALFDAWKADINLTDEERRDGRGNFSARWYTDRAEYLSLLLTRNSADINSSNSVNFHGLPSRFYAIDDVNQDRAIIYTGGANADNFANAARIVFGDDAANTPANSGADAFIGGNGNDRMYGMDGDDRLQGFNGNDYLEGGEVMLLVA